MRIRLRDAAFSYPRPRSGERSGPALAGINLDVAEGEFFTLLGPSGCGKTTLLWLLAGFLQPSGGDIFFDNERVNDLPPERRGAGVVFQNYALFPHMTVFDNAAFGPRSKRLPEAETAERVRRALELANLPATMASRRPSELSGGQQQRAALARAAAVHPRVLLMDEPLSNLDAALRLDTRRRVRRLQRDLGVTAVYVTHDQEEAFALSDRLAVMRHGRLLQIGTPEELYIRPERPFAARFLGRCNLLPVQLEDGGKTVRAEGVGAFAAPPRAEALAPDAREALLLVRPEQLVPVELACPESPPVRLRGRLADEEYLGERRVLSVESPAAAPGELIEVALHGASARRDPPAPGAEIELAFDPAECRLLPASDD
jgi:ABC-type Fe3+/spermidine/putrescine transport system ATPase subunit